MGIITGVERRRRWWLEEKPRIVAEVEESGASVDRRGVRTLIGAVSQ